jgi:predicted permease
MARTFEALRDVRPGFVEAAGIQTVRTWAPNAIARDAAQFTRVQREMQDAIAALPGVESVGFTSVLPMEGAPFNFNSVAMIEGSDLPPGDLPPARRIKLISPGYLAAMGTRVIAGRDLTWADVDAGGRVALVSEEFARELGGGDPAAALGRRIRTPNETDDWREVVGVVESVKEDALHTAAPSIAYWPALMRNAYGGEAFASPAIAFVVRSERAGSAALANEIREAIWSVNRDAPVALERTMQSLYGASLARTSFALVLLALASTMALVLGLVGIYGVIAYVVAQRSREIGIRLALGAPQREVRRMFLRQGLVLSAVGVGIGLVMALGVTRLMTSLLFGIAATDVVTYATAVAVIVAAAALASYLPARRAAAIDPIETLKAE